MPCYGLTILYESYSLIVASGIKCVDTNIYVIATVGKQFQRLRFFPSRTSSLAQRFRQDIERYTRNDEHTINFV